MLVKYNADSGVKAIPLVDLDPASVAEKGSVVGQILILVPGWNEIDPELWPNAEPTMEMEYQKGVFEYKFKDGVDEEGNPIRIQQTLGEIRADYARKTVEGCFNPANLEKWAEDPKLTSDLRALADIQLKKIRTYGE